MTTKKPTKKPLTVKQEHFVRCVIEGMTYADSYRTAYDAKNMSDEAIYVNASKLMSSANIALRVDELKQKLAEKVLYTAEESFKNLIELQNLAKENYKIIKDGKTSKLRKVLSHNNINSALKAEELKGRLTGLYIDRTASNDKVDITIGFE